MTPALPPGCVIALLGAAGTGKDELAGALRARLAQRALATPVLVVEDSEDCSALLAAEGHERLIALLMALDLQPAAGDDSVTLLRREQVDADLRSALARSGTPFAVIHGRGGERLSNAWTAIQARAEAGENEAAAQPRSARAAWAWRCDKCSDAACEHRLFSDLKATRA